jgi:hypothetical protein
MLGEEYNYHDSHNWAEGLSECGFDEEEYPTPSHAPVFVIEKVSQYWYEIAHRKGKEYYPYEPDEYYSDILEGATAKYTPELLVAFQKKFIKFLRFKIGAAYGEIENYKVFYDMQEKKIDSLNNELNDIYDNYGYTFR